MSGDIDEHGLEPLLRSAQVKRIYLEDHVMPADPPPGIAILQLLTASPQQAKDLVAHIVARNRQQGSDAAWGPKVIELTEEVLIRRFSQLSREEVRAMFHLEDLRKTRVWQEAHEEGVEKTRRDMVRSCLAKGMSAKDIAELLKISVREVRRLARSSD